MPSSAPHNKDDSLLDADSLSLVFSFLRWRDVLRARVCQKWQEAARLTTVSQSTIRERGMKIPELYIQNRAVASALQDWISIALPRLTTINFDFCLGTTEEFAIAPGEDSTGPTPQQQQNDTDVAQPSSLEPFDITVLSRFQQGLQHLHLRRTRLNGRYPCLFQFPNLQTLDLLWNTQLQWDLELLQGLPNLQRLNCGQNRCLNGNLKSMRVLQSTLVQLNLYACELVEGSLLDVADFPLLEKLNVVCTKITGDMGKLDAAATAQKKWFVSIKDIDVYDGVYGKAPFQTIDEAPGIMQARYKLKKSNPNLFHCEKWHLLKTSPDYYHFRALYSRVPPFWVEFIQAGPRLGWRWTNCFLGGSCEPQWLDPEPDPFDDSYPQYIKDLEEITRDVDFYRGFHQPPTREEHKQRNRDVPLFPDAFHVPLFPEAVAGA